MKKNRVMKEKLPEFCDFSCKYASFGSSDSVGACRKEVSIKCKKFGRYNNKHNKCLGLQ